MGLLFILARRKRSRLLIWYRAEGSQFNVVRVYDEFVSSLRSRYFNIHNFSNGGEIRWSLLRMFLRIIPGKAITLGM
jgi:hypothetical protein